MGQQHSIRAHAPLTFGYINNAQHGQEEAEEMEYCTRDRTSPDFVLDNPHLYRLESTCQHCSSKKTDYPMIVAEQVNTLCIHCRQNKRLSLVRRDLVNDLNYIDETYYPNIVHYEDDDDDDYDDENQLGIAASSSAPLALTDSTAEPSANMGMLDISTNTENNTISDQDNDEDDADTLRDEEGWSKLTIGEVTPSTPKRLVSPTSLAVDLSGKSLIKLSSSIGYLHNLTKLDLSDNQMISLPRAIGRLKNLRIFNASKNQLESIPDTITSLAKLKAINVSHNKLTALPKGIGSLPSLIILILNHNQLTQLPRELADLNDMITLNVSHNPLKTIPAEISALKSLRKLTAENCAFEAEMIHTLAHDPPSLFEICARKMVKSNISLPSSLAHHHIADYFKQEQACSFCFGPYFESFVSRSRFIERTGRQIIALDYKLCCAHWTDENDRISVMFSTPYYKQQQHSIAPNNNIATNTTTTTNTTAHGATCATTSTLPQAQHSYQSNAETESLFFSAPLSVSEEDDYFNQQGSHRFLFPAHSSDDIRCLPTTTTSTTENEALISSSAKAAAITTTTTTTMNTLPSSLTTSSNALNSSLRPRSLSTSLVWMNTMHNYHEHTSTLLQQTESLTLPFATLSGRQSEEADRILSRQQQTDRKPNGFKQGFAQLGARLGRKGNNNNSSRDRSETV